MPIAGVTNYPLVPVATPRRGAAESSAVDSNRTEDERAKSQSNKVSSAENQFRLGGEDATASRRISPAQQVESSKRASEVFSRRSAEDQDLSLTAKKALKAFADNSPTPGQRLGIDLAGIDTFA